MIVKICGLMRPEDAAAAGMAGADWAGMVFHPASRRCVSAEQAMAIRGALPQSVRSVAVVVDRDPEFVSQLVGSGIADMVQAHGCDDAYFRRVADLGIPTIRAYVMHSKEDVEVAASSEADYILLDAGQGSGRTFDWSLLEDVDFPYILSGGLDLNNVADAVGRLRPIGVDVSSGVETDGVKDEAKMRAFVDAARSVGSYRERR